MASTGSSKYLLRMAVKKAAAVLVISSKKANPKIFNIENQKAPYPKNFWKTLFAEEKLFSKIIATTTPSMPARNTSKISRRGSGWSSSFSQNQSQKSEGRNASAPAKKI